MTRLDPPADPSGHPDCHPPPHETCPARTPSRAHPLRRAYWPPLAPPDSARAKTAAVQGVTSGGWREDSERVGRWGRVIPHLEANELI